MDGWMDVCMHACMYVYTHVVKSYERAHRCRRQSGTQAALPGCQTSSWAKPGVKSWADTQRPISHDFINGYSWDTYYIYIYTYIYMIILICIYIQYMEPISYLGVSETHQQMALTFGLNQKKNADDMLKTCTICTSQCSMSPHSPC